MRRLLDNPHHRMVQQCRAVNPSTQMLASTRAMDLSDRRPNTVSGTLAESCTFQGSESLGLGRNGRTRLLAVRRDIVDCSKRSSVLVLEASSTADISRL